MRARGERWRVWMWVVDEDDAAHWARGPAYHDHGLAHAQAAFYRSTGLAATVELELEHAS